MLKKGLFSIFFMLICVVTFAQSQEYREKMRKEYEKRITMSHIDGVYIPEDMTDAFAQLNKLVSREARGKFKAMSEEDAMVKLHYSLGRWIWVNWKFLEGSRMSVHVKKYGVKNPEDMAIFVIVSYHRFLNGKDLNSPQLVELLNSRRADDEEKRRKAARN